MQNYNFFYFNPQKVYFSSHKVSQPPKRKRRFLRDEEFNVSNGGILLGINYLVSNESKYDK
jgi:hypothetical protein